MRYPLCLYIYALGKLATGGGTLRLLVILIVAVAGRRPPRRRLDPHHGFSVGQPRKHGPIVLRGCSLRLLEVVLMRRQISPTHVVMLLLVVVLLRCVLLVVLRCILPRLVFHLLLLHDFARARANILDALLWGPSHIFHRLLVLHHLRHCPLSIWALKL
jgi:hypothetical protein